MMPGIAQLNIEEFQRRINRFDQNYVNDWDDWLNTQPDVRPQKLGKVLRKWQACRPNRMRRIQNVNLHNAPYLEDLIGQAVEHIKVLNEFDIRNIESFSKQNCDALTQLWYIFQNLSYNGRVRNGLAGIVGISKAVLLLTEGRVGPAFDSKVRGHLGINGITNANEWKNALQAVTNDIQVFEKTNNTTLQNATPNHLTGLHSGRIYDMALGPGE